MTISVSDVWAALRDAQREIEELKAKIERLEAENRALKQTTTPA